MVIPAGYVPDQGDIIEIDHNPQAGHEQAGRRPALVLSVKKYNAASNLCLYCPITNTKKGHPFEIDIPKGLPITGTILSDQMRSLDWQAREAEHLSEVPLEIVQAVLVRINRILNNPDG